MGDLIDPLRLSTEEEKQFEEIIVRITRTAKVISGGKRMSFTALCVTGNRNGRVGYGYGKANEVPIAVGKATRQSRSNVITVPLAKGNTIPHEVRLKYKATKILLRPASPGTGLKAGPSVRAVLELAGIKNCLTKLFGSRNAINSVKAAWEALRRLRSKEQVEKLRGVKLFTPEPVPLEK